MMKDNLVTKLPFIGDNNQIEDSYIALVERAFIDYGLSPQSSDEAANTLKMDRKKFMDAHNHLRRSGKLIRINANIFIHQKHISHLVNMLHDFFMRKDILTQQDLREMFGLSRKYGIPLLEYLDSINFTVRVAEGRRLLHGKDLRNISIQ